MKHVFLLLFLILSGCLCYPPESENVTQADTLISIYEKATGLNMSNPITSTTIKYEVETIYKMIYNEYNISSNLSLVQEHNIKNMKPKTSGSSAHSAGYFECKYEVLEYMGWKPPKFSEKTSTIGQWFNYDFEEECLLVKNDSFTKYIRLNSSMWYITRGSIVDIINSTYNKTTYEDEKWLELRKV